MLINLIASQGCLDAAFKWVSHRRAGYSHNSGIWDLRIRWPEIRPQLQARLITGTYVFEPMTEIRVPSPGAGVEIWELWGAQDALVLKAMAMVLGEHLDSLISERCFHIAGRDGAGAAVRAVCADISPAKHVMKSDVKGY